MHGPFRQALLLTVHTEHVHDFDAALEVLDPSPKDEADDEDIAVENTSRGTQLYAMMSKCMCIICEEGLTVPFDALVSIPNPFSHF